MLANSKHWKSLRNWIKWGARKSKWEMLTTGAFLPALECVFINLLTGAPEGQRWPFILATAGVIGIHAILLAMQILPEDNYPFGCVADAVEAEERIKELNQELDRKTHACKMLRTAIETLNLQTCQLDPTASYAFAQGIHPVIERVTCNIRTALGVTTNEFTTEIYCFDGTVNHVNPHHCPTAMRQEYFYSPVSRDPCKPYALGNRAPHEWGVRRGVPGTCRITDDKDLFTDYGTIPEAIYFRVFCTVPIYAVCSTNIIGVLVLTSMQEEPLAADVLETLQFAASLISQYIASHNRCVFEWQDRNATPGVGRFAQHGPHTSIRGTTQ